MPSMYDMMYGNSTPDTQQGYGRPNTQMMQYGMGMLRGQNPFAMQTLPYASGGQTPQMQTLPYASGGPTPQMQTLPYPSGPNARSGKPRIRIGNKTYEEVDDMPMPAPQAPPQGGGY
jgi:hypothetical protein